MRIKGKRRTWLKVHFAIDIETFEIHCVCVTTNGIADGDVVVDLLKNTPNLGKTYENRAYDTQESRKAIKAKRGVIRNEIFMKIKLLNKVTARGMLKYLKVA